MMSCLRHAEGASRGGVVGYPSWLWMLDVQIK
jgi:hypothetical protein